MATSISVCCTRLFQHLKRPTTTTTLRLLSTNMTSEPQVTFEEHGAARVIKLNRPKQLNALTLNMIHQIYPKMMEWQSDDRVSVVIMKGVGGKAFCAGGDVVALVQSGAGLLTDDGYVSRQFMFDEYKLNYTIGTYKKPFVALLNGITMGGGVGLSVHGQYRVSTDNTLFAMPETAIGLFPDVGGSYFLPRLHGHMGMYLALTGDRIKGTDVYHAGVSSHHVKSTDMSELEQALFQVSSPRQIDELMAHFHQQSGADNTAYSLASHSEQIDKFFNLSTVEKIMQALEQDGSDWALGKLKLLKKMSPTSLKVTHEQITRGANMSFEAIFNMEYRICQHFIQAKKDFYEGVRAVLIDKDNTPKWDPSDVNSVTKEMVDWYFSALPKDRELNVKEPMQIPNTANL